MKGLDGWRRNVARFKLEHRWLRDMVDGQPSDWLRRPWDVHAYVDMFVESNRTAPYLMGHFWAVYLPLSILFIFI